MDEQKLVLTDENVKEIVNKLWERAIRDSKLTSADYTEELKHWVEFGDFKEWYERLAINIDFKRFKEGFMKMLIRNKDAKINTRLIEADIKSQVKDYLDVWHIFNYHLLQGIGSYKGLPDKIIHYKGKVVYLEIKRPRGVLSENQKAFQEQCIRDKIPYWVIRSLEDLVEKLNALAVR